jgi:hypothetical protein
MEEAALDWNALIGALVGAGIPATLVYIGLQRQRQSADAEAFGPAVVILDRVNPDRLTINLIPDPVAEAAMLADLQRQVGEARERLLVVAAGNPRRRVRKLARIAEVKLANVFHGTSWAVRDLLANRSNLEWMDHARELHAEALAAMEDLIEANFAWTGIGHGLRATHARAAGWAGRREPGRNDQQRPGARLRPKPLTWRMPRRPTPPGRGEHDPDSRPVRPRMPGAHGKPAGSSRQRT